MRIPPLVLAAALLLAAAARADGADLEPSRSLQWPPRGEAARRLPIHLRAQELSGRPDLEVVGEGEVEFRRGTTTIRADRITYDRPEDLATALGHVRVRQEGTIFSGPELRLHVDTFEGAFLEPDYDFTQLSAGGHARRIDFLDRARAVATEAIYTSCPRDGSGDPAWVLEARRVRLDQDANEGVAEGAVLRFYGVPILAAPSLSFALTEERKSGWLPPTLNLDSRSGLDLSVPYYWNIAPNRDATITPRIVTRRGAGAGIEFRYLEPGDRGAVSFDGLPDDRLYGSSRWELQWSNAGQHGGLRYGLDGVRVSDDDYWRDFSKSSRSVTPRLLSQAGTLARDFEFAGGGGETYFNVQRWQVLQYLDAPITSPYERSPQLGMRWQAAPGAGFEVALQTEYNRFTLARGDSRPEGNRWHALGSLARPFRGAGWWVVPKLSFNAASYDTDTPMADGGTHAGRTIPTASVDLGFEFERETFGFGRALRQTLEPRLLYVNTPYRRQSQLPVFDSAGRDFDFSSLFIENTFTGVDRVSDAHQLTAGVTTRTLDAASGVELLRLGIAERILFRDQQITAQPDGSPDGPPLSQEFSDVLVLGSTRVIPKWALDASVQYSPEISRAVRSVVSASYAPRDFHTIAATYRYTRDAAEQLELGWQWPLYTSRGFRPGAPPNDSSSCGGRVYGIGRVNYSLRDERLTDSIFGIEYDAGCWIGRIVAERLSIGSSTSTTRFLFQLELVGLSRLGSNPLQVLKDNIPGYRLLRDGSGRTSGPVPYD